MRVKDSSSGSFSSSPSSLIAVDSTLYFSADDGTFGREPWLFRAPSDISLTPATLPELQPAGTAVGRLSTTDPDAGDTFTYMLVSGDGALDNAAFTIVGDELRAAATFNFEVRASYSVRVRSTDQAGSVFEKQVSVAVSDVNEAPTAVAVANVIASLPENTSTAARIRVADIQITDDALGTATITLTGPDADAFGADGPAIFLKAGVALDFEAKATYAVVVSVADASLTGSTPVTVPFTLSVGDVNEPLAVEAAIDPDGRPYRAGEAISVTLVLSNIATIRGKPTLPIVIAGKTKQATLSGGSGTNRLTFGYRVESTDVAAAGRVAIGQRLTLPSGAAVTGPGGTAMPAALPTGVRGRVLNGVAIDTTAPRVSGRATGPSGTLRAGDRMAFAVRFSEPVLVEGVPQIALSGFTGAARQAVFVSGAGTATLVFEYVVRPGDAMRRPGALAAAKSISLPASPTRARITDLAGNAAPQANLKVSFPSLKSVVIAAAAASLSTTAGTGRPVVARAMAFASLR